MESQSLDDRWDKAFNRLATLASATVRRNAELENQVRELDGELARWRQAHASLKDSYERTTRAHNAQVASLNRRMTSANFFQQQTTLIICVLNGDHNVFLPSLLVQGYEGGRQAAQRLTKVIADHLFKEDVQLFGGLWYWVNVYYTKSRLVSLLQANNVCSATQFDSFAAGFSAASAQFSMVDVGLGRENGVDSKIRDYLQTYIRLPQTLRMFYCGGHEASMLDALESDHLGKLVLLSASGEAPIEFDRYPVACVSAEDLFMVDPVGTLENQAQSISPGAGSRFPSFVTNGGLISPQSPNQSPKIVDPALPLHKQIPPPCNEHYLMTCSKGAACKYSHSYKLTTEQLASLSVNAKKAPCNWLKNSLTCPYGDKCCWGHVCPNGIKCYHLSKGKCWFKGEKMHHHDPSSAQTPSTESFAQVFATKY